MLSESLHEMIPDRSLDEPVDRSDPVGPHSGKEQSVFLRLDADQGEHIPTNRVYPGVKMFRTNAQELSGGS